jgi:hypothetical protein
LKPYGGSVKNNTPLFVRATSLGLENFLPSKAMATGVFFFVLRSEALDAAIAGVRDQDAVRVIDRQAIGAGLAPDIGSKLAAPDGSRNFASPPFSDHITFLLPGTSVNSR